MRRFTFVAGALLVMGGCSSQTPKTTQVALDQSGTKPASMSVSTTSAPWASLSQQYQFPLHGGVTVGGKAGGTTYVGETETIAFFANTGGVMAWSTPEAPQANAGWPSSLADHDAAARAYVISVGIPEAEIGPTYHFRGFTSGAAIATPHDVTTSPLGFSTTFGRVVQGIPVIDSTAGVRLNAQGAPISLKVEWPAVPADALASAQALQATVAAGWTPPASIVDGRQVATIEAALRHVHGGLQTMAWAAVIRTEVVGTTGVHSFIDSDSAGNLISLMNTSGVTPNTK